MEAYVDRVVNEITAAHAWAEARGLVLPAVADTVFVGGGTPSLLSAAQMRRLLEAVRLSFGVAPEMEITVEAAPGQLADDLLEAMLEGGVNRVSLGVQSFVDAESRAVGRLHTAAQCVKEIERLQAAGVPRLNVDLIAGLPLQTEASWRTSLDALIASGIEHASVYMLELDEESRLGSEVLRHRAVSQLEVLGQEARYGAAAVPDDDRCAALYDMACDALELAGLRQYEISNFACTGAASRHNLRYWKRAPYLGVGLDAHSMLFDEDGAAVRFARTEELEAYVVGEQALKLERVSALEAFEETVFLGLRLTCGVSLEALRLEHGNARVEGLVRRGSSLAEAGLLRLESNEMMLTRRGRAVSSAVFGELLACGS